MDLRRIIPWLVTAIVLLVSVNIAAFTFKFWGPPLVQQWDDYWKQKLNKPAEKAGDRTISDCLQVSDFYSVHLTTYFLADSSENAGGATDDLRKYSEYCNQVPGTGKVIFALTLMEKEVRNEPVALSFYKYAPNGELQLLNELPSKSYPSGMISIEGRIDHSGKYLLKAAFGEAKNKEDTIEMPITAGK
jgi:hypothetical protein